MEEKEFYKNVTKNSFQNNFNSDTSETVNLQPEEKTKKAYWKFVLAFLVIMFVALFGYPIVKNTYYSYVADKSINSVLQMQAQYLDALKNDTFGGKTPQETYEMFVKTLQSGNILDAAKFYMRDEDRISAYKKFDDMQKNGNFENWIVELPKWSVMKEVDYWDKDGKEFDYEYTQKDNYTFYDEALQKERTILAGKRQKAIIFEINKSANIWKIYEL